MVMLYGICSERVKRLTMKQIHFELTEAERRQLDEEGFLVLEQLAVPGLDAERCIVWMRAAAAVSAGAAPGLVHS